MFELFSILKKSLWDYKPFGTLPRSKKDCSNKCKHYIPLSGKFKNDFGVCKNTKSFRCGLMTYKHQGCKEYEKYTENNTKQKR